MIDWAAGVCAVVSVATAARMTWLYWSGPANIFLRVKSSVWVALAWTFAHGEFYRPVLGPAGYGGTRYMPLMFVTHGLLIRAGADPIWSGVVVMHLSVLAAAIALFAALRHFHVEARLAAALSALVWGTVIFQQSAADLSPDYLAAALALGGAVTAFGGERPQSRVRAGVAPALFVLAATAKITAIAFAAPVALALWRDDRRSDAVRFASWTGFGLLAALAGIDAVSRGRFHASFVASATAGLTLDEAIHAAPQLLRELAIKPVDVALPFALAVWCAVASRRRAWAHDYLVGSVLVSLVIFAVPGTASNHLVDLHLASIVVIGAAVARGTVRRAIVSAMLVTIAAMLVAITIPLPIVPSVVADVRAALPRPRDAAIAIRGELLTRGPYLALDAIVPVLNGDSPWVVDYGSLERYYVDRTPAGRDFEARVRERFFTAVVLPDGYESELTPLLRACYRTEVRRKPFVVLLP